MTPVRIAYQTIEFGKIDIHLRTLRDNQQYSDPNGVAEKLGIHSGLWPLFGVVWPSSLVLSHFLLHYNFANKRILEIGCGIGLSSLLLNRLSADITATDYHPEVEGFLNENAQLNKDEKIPFVLADWKNENAELGTFDLIVGSDVLYESDQIKLLSKFINHHAKKSCTVIVVDPGRGHQAKFSKQMNAQGFSSEAHAPEDTSFLEKPFSGKICEFAR